MAEKPGNYVIAAGKTGSGKTAFLNHLVRYLATVEKDFAIEPVADSGGADSLLDDWALLWDEGKLVAQSAAGQPKDHVFQIRPGQRHKDKPTIEAGFLEISGADLEALAAGGEPAPALPGALTAILAAHATNAVLILVCDGADAADAEPKQDALLAAFVLRLRADFGDAVTTRRPVLILATKLGRKDIATFAGDTLPAMLAALQDWRAGYALAELDLGAIEIAPDGEPLLPSPKFEDIAKIFRWVYFQFTRYPVVDPFFSKLWKSVRKSIS